jgi:hypothetical protein
MNLSLPAGFVVDAQGPYIITAPTDDRDYSLDWTNVIATLGPTPPDTIATSTWNVFAPNVEGTTAQAGAITTVWITSPAIGEYYVSNTIVTAGGRTFTRGFRLFVSANV